MKVLFFLLLAPTVVLLDNIMDEATKKKIKDFLGTKTLEKTGFQASGCINEGEGYCTDKGLVFIKKNGNEHVLAFKILTLVLVQRSKTLQREKTLKR